MNIYNTSWKEHSCCQQIRYKSALKGQITVLKVLYKCVCGLSALVSETGKRVAKSNSSSAAYLKQGRKAGKNTV